MDLGRGSEIFPTFPSQVERTTKASHGGGGVGALRAHVGTFNVFLFTSIVVPGVQAVFV